MRFVEVEMTGGLGNQLFKWANGFKIAQHFDASLILNTSFYRRFKYSPETSSRNFELSQIHEISNTFAERKRRGFLNPYLQKFGSDFKIIQLINEKSLSSSEPALYSLVRGNFEALRYLPDRDLVRSKFQLNDLNKFTLEHLNDFSEDKIIAMHVRLGDYLKFSDIYNILPENYYLEALKIAKSHFPNATVYLFTDDENNARKLFPSLIYAVDRIFAPTEIPPREILTLMSRATAIVCANSTFSWWASYLASSETLSIIPSKFNNLTGDQTAENLRMPNQIMLSV